MSKHLRYLKYLLLHKLFVFIAGLYCRVSLWRLIKHDASKFLPDEWSPYVDHFYGEATQATQVAFDAAWNKHQKRNDHHWQHWLLVRDRPTALWTMQAHQPESGPVYLVRENTHVAEMIQTDRDALRTVEEGLRFAPQPLKMPEQAMREMVADWLGAGRAITGKWDALAWYTKNQKNIHLHPETRFEVEQLLRAMDAKLNKASEA